MPCTVFRVFLSSQSVNVLYRNGLDEFRIDLQIETTERPPPVFPGDWKAPLLSRKNEMKAFLSWASVMLATLVAQMQIPIVACRPIQNRLFQRLLGGEQLKLKNR